MPRIFISYRRADTELIVGRIYDRLVMAFGEQYVFKDVERIPPGQDFRDVIKGYVNSCDVMLAMIGPQWLTVTESDGTRRIDNPHDFVRFELSEALQRADVLVIPAYVMLAKPITADDLPAELEKLAYNNGIQIRNDPDFNTDMRRLIEYLRDYDQQRRAGRSATVFPPSDQLQPVAMQPPPAAAPPAVTPAPARPNSLSRMAILLGGGAVVLVVVLCVLLTILGGLLDTDADGDGSTNDQTISRADFTTQDTNLPFLGTAIRVSYPETWVVTTELQGFTLGSDSAALQEAVTSAATGIPTIYSRGAALQIGDLPHDVPVGTYTAQLWATDYQDLLLNVGYAVSSPVQTSWGGKSGYQISYVLGSTTTEYFFYEASADLTVVVTILTNGAGFDDETEAIIDSITLR